MKYTFETEFDVGDLVYHKIPESDQGIITGILYDTVTGMLTYYVTFDPKDGDVKCYDFELSLTKTFS